MLSINNVSVSAPDKDILRSISLSFAKGKTYALMGPNGSGKSTLAQTIMGNPHYTVKRGGKIMLNGKNITGAAPDERSRLGLFLSFQNPLPLPGVSVRDLLRLALEKRLTPMELHTKIKTLAAELHIKDELLSRSLNDGFSGGEKKKLEALQAALLQPSFALFDELDTGVDVDAIKLITKFLKKHLPKGATLVFITHSTRMLSVLKPNEVVVMKDGRVAKTGKGDLAKKIEMKGFDWIK